MFDSSGDLRLRSVSCRVHGHGVSIAGFRWERRPTFESDGGGARETVKTALMEPFGNTLEAWLKSHAAGAHKLSVPDVNA